jgi:hypothetical protein
MLSLEQLALYLIVGERKTFFDGNDFKMNIMNHMPRLKKLMFNIRSSSYFYNQINLPSNEDVQKTFRDFINKQIIHCADYFPMAGYGQCHIYSYPYKMKHYDNITNSFPGGIFSCVSKVSLFDESPFEHEFFLRIAQSFPLMEDLTVVNKQQQIKRFIESKNENQDLTIIKYPHLKRLYLVDTCEDYHEQFLFDTKTCLPFDICVFMDYELVKKVTSDFRRNTTLSNCAKMNYVCLSRKMEFPTYSNNFCGRKQLLPEHVKDYFPHAKID